MCAACLLGDPLRGGRTGRAGASRDGRAGFPAPGASMTCVASGFSADADSVPRRVRAGTRGRVLVLVDDDMTGGIGAEFVRGLVFEDDDDDDVAGGFTGGVWEGGLK